MRRAQELKFIFNIHINNQKQSQCELFSLLSLQKEHIAHEIKLTSL